MTIAFEEEVHLSRSWSADLENGWTVTFDDDGVFTVDLTPDGEGDDPFGFSGPAFEFGSIESMDMLIDALTAARDVAREHAILPEEMQK